MFIECVVKMPALGFEQGCHCWPCGIVLLWRWLESCVNPELRVTDPRPASDQITEFSCSALCDNTVGGVTVFWKPLQPLQWFRLSKLSGRHVSWGQKSLPAEGWLMVEMRDLGSLAEHQKHCVFTRCWLNPLLPEFLSMRSFVAAIFSYILLETCFVVKWTSVTQIPGCETRLVNPQQ